MTVESATQSPRRLGRSIGAVLAGLVAIVLLSTVMDAVLHSTGVFAPPGEPMANSLWLLATAYRIVFGVVGCYIAARLAPNRPMRHALVLGSIGVVVSLAGFLATRGKGPGFGPSWYPLGLVAIALPSAWVGGKLHAMRGTKHVA